MCFDNKRGEERPVSESSPVNVDSSGAIQRLVRRTGAASWEASQWEQAYFDLKDQTDAVIASLSGQIEALTQQLAAAGKSTAEVTQPESET